MGGMHGFGPVEPEPDEPVFHETWEGRVYAINRALGPLGIWTIDDSRYAQETLRPTDYIGASYYERWMLGLEKRLLEKDLMTSERFTMSLFMIKQKSSQADVRNAEFHSAKFIVHYTIIFQIG